jgi:hypothetical protein
MEIRQPEFDVWIEPEDLGRIPRALAALGEPPESVEAFHGAALYRLYEAWRVFVTTDWTRWDVSEYLNDLRCRHLIQIAIDASTPATRERLADAAERLDAQFRSRMRPLLTPYQPALAANRAPYFWENHTIHDTRPEER